MEVCINSFLNCNRECVPLHTEELTVPSWEAKPLDLPQLVESETPNAYLPEFLVSERGRKGESGGPSHSRGVPLPV